MKYFVESGVAAKHSLDSQNNVQRSKWIECTLADAAGFVLYVYDIYFMYHRNVSHKSIIEISKSHSELLIYIILMEIINIQDVIYIT